MPYFRALVCAFILLLPATANAAFISATGTFSWTEISPILSGGLSSADDFHFDFATGTPGLEITQLDITIGSGAALSLFPDPVAGGSGFLTFGNGPLTTYGGAGYLGTAAPGGKFGDGTSLANRDASGAFSGLESGTGFHFYLDIDRLRADGATSGLVCSLDCDDLNYNEFIAGGAFTYTLHFSYNGQAAGTHTAGAESFSKANNDSAVSNWAFRTEISDPIPEPGTYTLLGAGLIVLGLLRRRKK